MLLSRKRCSISEGSKQEHVYGQPSALVAARCRPLLGQYLTNLWSIHLMGHLPWHTINPSVRPSGNVRQKKLLNLKKHQLLFIFCLKCICSDEASSVCMRDNVVFFWIGLVIVDTYVDIAMSGLWLSISLMNSGGAYILARTTFKMLCSTECLFVFYWSAKHS